MNNPTLTATWSCVLFDLDGTITDSAPGITASIAHTLAAMKRPIPSREELIRYVGPPILDSFRDLAHFDADESRIALDIYRADYRRGGEFDSAIYPGMRGVLRRVARAGIPIAVATSKPESLAREILDHFELSELVTVIAGASDDETRSAKADVVAEALRRLRAQDVDVSATVLVGDRSHDVVGARENGLPTILVEWGYGSPAEAEGAIAVVHATDQLEKLLLPGSDAPES